MTTTGRSRTPVPDLNISPTIYCPDPECGAATGADGTSWWCDGCGATWDADGTGGVRESDDARSCPPP